MTAETLTTLLARLRNHLGDLNSASYQFSDAQLTQWLNAAIFDYSIHFPRKKNSLIALTPGTHYYEMPLDFHSVLTVQYSKFNPTLTPQTPEYFTHRSHKHPDFWERDGFYDIWKHQEEIEQSWLIISRDPYSAMDTIVCYYHGDHTSLVDAADECSLPVRHLHLLDFYVRWMSLQNLSTLESMSPTTSVDGAIALLDKYEANVRLAEAAYRSAMADARSAESETGVSEWRMDKWDGGY